MKRRAFVSGAAAAAGAVVLGGHAATAASADTASAVGGVLSIAKFDAVAGRWPARPSTGMSVVWMDMSGGAPKPAMANGDVYLQASKGKAVTSAASGELLLPTMKTFGVPWESRGGAVITTNGGASISRAGDRLILANIPVVAGDSVTCKLNCTSGDVALTLEFWDKYTPHGHKDVIGNGEVTISGVVPSGATVANLLLDFHKQPATFSAISLVKSR